MPPRFVEVSHVIEPGMVTYPGLPVPEAKVIVDHDTSRARYGGKSEFLIASLHLCGNTGTYVDSPVHRHRGAPDLASLPLERLAHVPVRLFDARSLGRAVGPQLFAGADLRGAAVLVRTDFSHLAHGAYAATILTDRRCLDLLVGRGFLRGHRFLTSTTWPLARPSHTILLAPHADLRAHDQPR